MMKPSRCWWSDGYNSDKREKNVIILYPETFFCSSSTPCVCWCLLSDVCRSITTVCLLYLMVFFSSPWCNKRDGFYTRTTFDFYPQEKRGVGSGNLKTLGELTGKVRDVEFFKNRILTAEMQWRVFGSWFTPSWTFGFSLLIILAEKIIFYKNSWFYRECFDSNQDIVSFSVGSYEGCQ